MKALKQCTPAAPTPDQEERLNSARFEIAGLVNGAVDRRRELLVHVERKLRRINAPVVLIVEDDDALAQWFAAVVERMRAIPHVCGNGLQAHAFACEEPIDFYLIDLNLPGIDGIELAERIRGRAMLPLSPILFVSGEVDAAVLAKIAEIAGANGWVHKPVREVELQREVCRLLPLLSSTGP